MKGVEELDFDKMLERESRKRKAKRFVAKVVGIAAAIGLLVGVKANAAEYPGLLRIEQTEGSTVAR